MIEESTRTALAPTRLANDARASTAMQSGKPQGEAPPHRVHTAPVPTAEASSTSIVGLLDEYVTANGVAWSRAIHQRHLTFYLRDTMAT